MIDNCQFTKHRKPLRDRPCREVYSLMHTMWCGACLMQHYDPERFAREVEALQAGRLVDPSPLETT